jgi:thiol:disulfide interchange protein DsbD
MIRRLFLLLSLCLPLGAFAAEELLEVDKAFRLSARALDAGTLEIRYDIAKGYYLYRDKFKFALEPAAAQAGAPQIPPGKVKQDEFFGAVETYRKEVVIRLPFTAPAGAEAVTLKATSQGCADLGVCYPPNTQSLQVALAAMSTAPAAPIEAAGGAPEDESSKLAGLLKHAGFWLILTTFFGAGLLLALTPCVFPMIPILSGIIVGHGHHRQRPRLQPVDGLRAGHGRHLRRRRGGRGPVRHAALGGPAEPWVLGAFAAGLRRAVALHVRLLRAAAAHLPAEQLSEDAGHLKGGSPARRGRDGCPVGADRRPLRGGPAGRRPALHRPDAAMRCWAARRSFAMALGMGVPLDRSRRAGDALLPAA